MKSSYILLSTALTAVSVVAKAVDTPYTEVGARADPLAKDVKFAADPAKSLDEMAKIQRIWDAQEDVMRLAEFMYKQYTTNRSNFEKVMKNWFPDGSADQVGKVYGKIMDGALFNTKRKHFLSREYSQQKMMATLKIVAPGDLMPGGEDEETCLADKAKNKPAYNMFTSQPTDKSWKEDLRGDTTGEMYAWLGVCPDFYYARLLDETFTEFGCSGFNGIIGQKMTGITATLLHELTHFFYVGSEALGLNGKSDIDRNIIDMTETQSNGKVKACYGSFNAHSIAKHDTTIENADSYKWFAMELYWRSRCSKTEFNLPTACELTGKPDKVNLLDDAQRPHLDAALKRKVLALYPDMKFTS